MKYLDHLDPDREFVAFDVETTGRSTHLDVVAEIGAILYRRGVEVDRLVTLVKPSTSMLPWITQLTGITDRMLASAPPAPLIARRLAQFVRRRPLVIHNAAFDMPLLERFFFRHLHSGSWDSTHSRAWSPPPVLCTLRLSRRLLPHLHSRRLQALADYFDFVPRKVYGNRFHRAGTDAEAAAHVFFCLSALMGRT